MWNTLFALFKSEISVTSLRDMANAISSLMFILQKDYLKDGNARDAAIDAVCEILQSHKSNQNKVS